MRNNHIVLRRSLGRDDFEECTQAPVTRAQQVTEAAAQQSQELERRYYLGQRPVRVSYLEAWRLSATKPGRARRGSHVDEP